MISYYGEVTSKHTDTGHSSVELRLKCGKPAVPDTSCELSSYTVKINQIQFFSVIKKRTAFISYF